MAKHTKNNEKWEEAMEIANHVYDNYNDIKEASLYRKNSGIPAEQLSQQNSIEKKLAAVVEAARRANNA
jgi:hypothetical protein